MKLTVIDDRVRIDFENGDTINTEHDNVRTTSIEFGFVDFALLVGEFDDFVADGLAEHRTDVKLPPRCCGNCRSLVENRDADEMFCRTGDQVKPTNRYNTCNKHVYWKGWIN